MPLNEYEFPTSKLSNVQSQLEKLVEKNYYLHQSAKEAFRWVRGQGHWVVGWSRGDGWPVEVGQLAPHISCDPPQFYCGTSLIMHPTPPHFMPSSLPLPSLPPGRTCWPTTRTT